MSDEPTVLYNKRTPKPRPAKRAQAQQPEPAQQLAPSPEHITLQALIVFHVDGKPVLGVPLSSLVERMAPEATEYRMQIGLDARAVLSALTQALEPTLGPAPAALRVWTPGGH